MQNSAHTNWLTEPRETSKVKSIHLIGSLPHMFLRNQFRSIKLTWSVKSREAKANSLRSTYQRGAGVLHPQTAQAHLLPAARGPAWAFLAPSGHWQGKALRPQSPDFQLKRYGKHFLTSKQKISQSRQTSSAITARVKITTNFWSNYRFGKGITRKWNYFFWFSRELYLAPLSVESVSRFLSK